MPKLDKFYEYFKNINSNDYVDQTQNQPSKYLNDHPAEYNTDTLNSNITSKEIGKMIDKSSNSKAKTLYLMNTLKVQKLVCYLYTQFFLITFFNSGILPDAWLMGTIQPIYKNKGYSLDPVNYRTNYNFKLSRKIIHVYS